MSQDRLSLDILRQIDKCSLIASRNLVYYENVYDKLEDSDDRDIIGQAMAQKRSFVDAMQVVLNSHDYPATTAPNNRQTDETGADYTRQSQYIVQEDLFTSAMSECLTLIGDQEFSDLLLHHLNAAHLASEAIKSSSLKL